MTAMGERDRAMSRSRRGRRWTLLSNHGQVLVCLAREPQMTMRDLSSAVGITERACYRIVADLVEAGLLRRQRVGRNNHYIVERGASLRHPAWAGMHSATILDVS
jgi:DNA-binding MarR family transcriptional regulator